MAWWQVWVSYHPCGGSCTGWRTSARQAHCCPAPGHELRANLSTMRLAPSQDRLVLSQFSLFLGCRSKTDADLKRPQMTIELLFYAGGLDFWAPLAALVITWQGSLPLTRHSSSGQRLQSVAHLSRRRAERSSQLSACCLTGRIDSSCVFRCAYLFLE